MSSHVDRAKLVSKGFIVWEKEQFFLRDTVSNQDSVMLPSRGANHNARFGLPCPLTELAIK